jgi:hypothetical protein
LQQLRLIMRVYLLHSRAAVSHTPTPRFLFLAGGSLRLMSCLSADHHFTVPRTRRCRTCR